MNFLILNPIFCSYLHMTKLSQATHFFYQLELSLSLSEFPHFEPYLSLYIHLFTIISHLSSNFTRARTLSSPIFFILIFIVWLWGSTPPLSYHYAKVTDVFAILLKLWIFPTDNSAPVVCCIIFYDTTLICPIQKWLIS